MRIGGDRLVLIVGCGNIGSRHLQSLASLPAVGQIEVVDSRPEGLQLGRTRLQEITNANPATAVQWLSSLDDASRDGDLCIVATQAEGRPQLVRQIADTLGYSSFILEKLVSQSVQDMDDLCRYSAEKGLSIWVNCKARAYRFHQRAKRFLNPEDQVIFNVVGGNDGLATGGVQDADLFAFYDDARGIESLGSQIDQVLHPSKRGDNIFDLSGTLLGSTEKGSIFTLSHARDSGSWGHISIATRQYRCIVDHLHRTAFESAEQSGWVWREIPFDGPILISEMTREFAADIFEFGRCALPSIDESLVSHRFILSELQPHFSRLLGHTVDQCPVT